MADRTSLVTAVLAAGSSRRFGAADKLTAPFRGKPLGLHVCDTLRRLPATHRLVVAADDSHACATAWNEAGFAVVLNPNAGEGMGTSVASAARIARRASADHVLIALADMPLVPAEHYASLVATAREGDPSAIVCSTDGTLRMPPVVFGRKHFDVLAELSGDYGARELLARGDSVLCLKEWLVDIDTPRILTTFE